MSVFDRIDVLERNVRMLCQAPTFPIYDTQNRLFPEDFDIVGQLVIDVNFYNLSWTDQNGSWTNGPTPDPSSVGNVPQDAVEGQIAIGSDGSLNWFIAGQWWSSSFTSSTVGNVPQDIVAGQIAIGTDQTLHWYDGTTWNTFGTAAPVGPTIIAVIPGEQTTTPFSRTSYLMSDLTFTIATDPTASHGSGVQVAYNGTTWVIVGGGNFLKSTDGITWTDVGNPFNPDSDNFSSAGSIVWCDSLGLFVAGGSGSNDAGDGFCIATSPNGTTWTLQSTPWDISFGQVNGVAWSHDLGQILACGSAFDGSGHVLMKSSNGISWSNVTTPLTGNQVEQCAWSPLLGLWIAAGNPSGVGGAGTAIMNSSNGTSWTTAYTSPGSSDNPTPNDAFWSSVLDMFVVPCNASSFPMLISNDGNSWRYPTTPPFVGAGCHGVYWSATISKLISVSLNNASIFTSSDGETWANVVTPIGFHGQRLFAL